MPTLIQALRAAAVYVPPIASALITATKGAGEDQSTAKLDFCVGMADKILEDLERHINITNHSEGLTINDEQRKQIRSKLYELFSDDVSIHLMDRIIDPADRAGNNDRKQDFINKLLTRLTPQISGYIEIKYNRLFSKRNISINPDLLQTWIDNNQLRRDILQVIAANLGLFRIKTSTADCSQLSVGDIFYYIAYVCIDYRETEVICINHPNSINEPTSDKGYLPLHWAIIARAELRRKVRIEYFDNIIKTLLANGADPQMRKIRGTGIILSHTRPGQQSALEQVAESLRGYTDQEHVMRLLLGERYHGVIGLPESESESESDEAPAPAEPPLAAQPAGTAAAAPAEPPPAAQPAGTAAAAPELSPTALATVAQPAFSLLFASIRVPGTGGPEMFCSSAPSHPRI